MAGKFSIGAANPNARADLQEILHFVLHDPSFCRISCIVLQVLLQSAQSDPQKDRAALCKKPLYTLFLDYVYIYCI